MAFNGSNGYLYSMDFAAATTCSSSGPNALDTDAWYKFISVSTGSSDANIRALKENDLVYNSTALGLTLSTGVGVQAQKATITKIAFCTDLSDSETKEKFEQTVQTDDVKSYQVGTKPEVTGTINGYLLPHSGSTSDVVQRGLLNRFRVILRESTGASLKRDAPSEDDFHMLLSYNEGTTDKYQIWAYKPSIIDSLTMDKPMEGPVTFSFNYTENGSERPNMFYILTTN
jgi:hypothetical protein